MRHWQNVAAGTNLNFRKKSGGDYFQTDQRRASSPLKNARAQGQKSTDWCAYSTNVWSRNFGHAYSLRAIACQCGVLPDVGAGGRTIFVGPLVNRRPNLAFARCLRRFGNFTFCPHLPPKSSGRLGESLGATSAALPSGLSESAFSPMFSKVIKWSGRRDLNPRPLAPQASALAGLRYAPTEIGLKPAQILAGERRVSITEILAAVIRVLAIVRETVSKTDDESENEDQEERSVTLASSPSSASRGRKRIRHIPSASRSRSGADAR